MACIDPQLREDQLPALPLYQRNPPTSRSSSPIPSLSRHSPPHNPPSEPDEYDLFGESLNRYPSRIPTTRSLDDAILYWEKGDSTKGLTIPLRQWQTLFTPDQYRSEAQKLAMIKHVWEEYNDICGRDMEEFEKRFPGLRNRYSKLIQAVRQARIARGSSTSRPKRVRS